MALSAGDRLGPYEIVGALGAGGMGEVYRARDTRLDRAVAVKVLPSELSASPRLRARLEREARVVSQLSHPHICVLHDIGHHGGAGFLVMELLEGETLAERLGRGALPLDETLRIGSEIAGALDAAHRHGVVHRDLKPGNVMLTRSGAKLLDFGLSKLRGPGGAAEVSAVPTEAVTEEGTILGTVPYMAPEQLEGKEADARADLFAFGATLYEMLAGQRAFRGDNRASLIAAIMSSDPRPVSELRPTTPPSLDRVVKRCLAKDPERRWQSAGDLAAELEWVRESAAEETEPRPAPVPRGMRGRRAWAASVVAAAVLAALATALYFGRERRAIPDGSSLVSRFHLNLPEGLRLVHRSRHGIALSPDGRWVAYLGATTLNETDNQIYLRPFDHWDSRSLPNTRGAQGIVFSPDSKWLAFAQREEGGLWAIKRVSVEKGQVLTICGGLAGYGQHGTGISWGDDDWIVFDGDRQGLKRVPAAGGRPEPLDIELPDEPSDTRMQLPFVLPGSRSILFTAVRHRGYVEPRFTDIYAWSAETGVARKVVAGATDARYVPTGHLVFAREGNLHAAPFDAARLRPTGPEVRIMEGVSHAVYIGWVFLETGAAQFSVSASGRLAYAPGSVAPDTKGELVWVDRRGRVELVDARQEMGPLPSVRLSPDQGHLLLGWGGRPHGIRVYDLRRRTMQRLTFEGRSMWAIWGPRPDTFTFESDMEGPARIYIKALGSGPEEVERVPTGEATGWHVPSSWSSDRRTLLFSQETTGKVLVWTSSGGQPSRLTDPAFSENHPEFSPDGRWIAYTSYDSDGPEVYVRPHGHPGRTYKVSTNGGAAPAWTRGGAEIVYRRAVDSGEQRRQGFYAVSFGESDDGVRLGEPVFLFEGHYLASTPTRRYDVTPDGERFILVREGRDEVDLERHNDMLYPRRIHVVQNWFAELQSIAGQASWTTDADD